MVACRGDSPAAPPLTCHGVVPPVPAATSRCPPDPQPLLPQRRAAPAARPPRPMKVARADSTHVDKVVLVNGQQYCAISWFFGEDTTSKTRSIAKKHCAANALEMCDGNFVSIVNYGFASRPPALPAPLLPRNTDLYPVRWAKSRLESETGTLKVRLAGDPLRCDLRQVLFLKTDLENLAQQM